MSIAVAIYLFPEVEVLDFAGPFEVFTTASRLFKKENPSAPAPFTVFTMADNAGTVRTRAGLVVTPDFTFANHPPIDLLLVPGGIVTEELQKPEVIEWVKRTAATTRLTASVCTGASLLARAGLLDGKKATTHWADIDDMRAEFPAVTVLYQRRWVDEGDIVTSAGISAGIDMSVHLVERFEGRELALRTARQMEYEWHEATTEERNGHLAMNTSIPVMAMRSCPSIFFSQITPEQLDLIRPLWEQLNQHHAALPSPFASGIAACSFDSRLEVLRDKAASGRLRVEIACTSADESPMAYCVASISQDGAGELDSLFVSPSHRRTGVGSALVQRALDWLREAGAVSLRVVVLHDNAEAESFYHRFGFQPRNIELELLPMPRNAQ
jgi:putative intracellular protease/amidase/GNAT superfamily N-acetyltransferase